MFSNTVLKTKKFILDFWCYTTKQDKDFIAYGIGCVITPRTVTFTVLLDVMLSAGGVLL
jgi:hypothetical protein